MTVNSWSDILDALLLRKVSFLVSFFVVFLLSYAFLAWIDFLPEMVEKKSDQEKVEENINVSIVETQTEEGRKTEKNQNEGNSSLSVSPTEAVLPIKMNIPALERSVTVLNPDSRNIADLDAALLSGVVRHPDSASLNQDGTVFLLGHSSYLPVVRNKNFQAFNGIQNLKWGDLIILDAAEGQFVYKVDKVYRAKAQDVTVPIAGPTKRLYLATCNSFGSTDDRYIVEAEFVEVRSY
jgi:LPXTG-site transpeptidase (sortase) family protein